VQAAENWLFSFEKKLRITHYPVFGFGINLVTIPTADSYRRASVDVE